MSLAPLVVFAYKRPDHVTRLLASLRQNPEAADSRLYVYCDGPRSPTEADDVRRTRVAVTAAGFKRLEVVARDANVGLAANVIEGVTRVCGEHGRVIVLEDDLVVAPTFLRYMNAALQRYAAAARVHAISGFQYPIELPASCDAVFLPFISSWGWATWGRAWEAFDASAAGAQRVLEDASTRRRFDLGGKYGFSRMLRKHLAGRNNSWAIRWYLSTFLRDGLTLFPRKSLVENRGFGDDATHCVGPTPHHMRSRAVPFEITRFPEVALDAAAFEAVRQVMGADSTLVRRAIRKLRAVARV